ncbi:PTS sugar transporter subunit IIA [Gluconacetobacter tumulisoli]|uniref:PTS sugar transporter subunit IIA n=1 Tax=Gluconacetobacter tumulisoli TaxID=1286189 RepID=A0A7W4PMU3_9PROT|nr:PTS sugar transporter subunit IIA [Gluconacetobacter tumulisoli]MBB2201999.1 PTS sugar transporter subunit IIA [Gluconacetobacter tumulisoli]
MIGMVLVTHGELGETLRRAMEHVVGPQSQMTTLNIEAGDDPVLRRGDLQVAIAGVDTGDGVLLLTDMFGSTPSNLAISTLEEGRVEVLAGVNVPMLVKLAQIRNGHTLAECADMAEGAGRKYISTASHLPPQCLGGARSCLYGDRPAEVPPPAAYRAAPRRVAAG